MKPKRRPSPDRLEDVPLPLLDHVTALRHMIIRMVLSVVTGMALAFLFRSHVAAFIQSPLLAVDPSRIDNLQSLGVADSMTISLRLSFYVGLIVSFPVLLYFLAQFVLPALTLIERKALLAISLVGFVLFVIGIMFGFFVALPIALDFFFKDAQMMQWQPTWTVGEYYSFTTQFVLAFGLSFELPVTVLALVKFGIMSPTQMRKTRPQAIVVIFILASVITPTTDIFTLFLMGGPMLLLYELCIWAAEWGTKPKETIQ